jgi:hypothetical protein
VGQRSLLGVLVGVILFHCSLVGVRVFVNVTAVPVLMRVPDVVVGMLSMDCRESIGCPDRQSCERCSATTIHAKTRPRISA